MGETATPNMTRDTDHRDRDEKGRVKEMYPLDDVHAALKAVGPSATQVVADELGCAYATAYEKLRALEDEGRISSRKVANARLWTPNGGDDE